MNLSDLYTFWFEDIEISKQYYDKKIPQWFFGKDLVFDERCKDFEELLTRESVQNIEIAKLSNQDYLSLIILYDQITRNIYRGSKKAYEFDGIARLLCLKALDTPREFELNHIEKLFLYMPLEHSENLEMQKISVLKFEELHASSPLSIKEYTALSLLKAKEHFEAIALHGIFHKRVR